jgi:TolA-binding protein
MMHKKTRAFIEYFRTDTDPKNKRRALRLPARIPLLYSLSGQNGQFHECLATDVSRDGICVELRDIYPKIRKTRLSRDKRLFLKLLLPEHDKNINIAARIRWIYPEDPRLPGILKVGCEFDGLETEARIEILHYGLKLVRRKQITKAASILFAAAFLFSIVWLWAATAAEKQAKTMLKESEIRRLALLTEKEYLGKNIENMKRILAGNFKTLAGQRASLLVLNRKIKDQADILDQRDSVIRNQDLRILEADRLISDKSSVITQRTREIDRLTGTLEQKTAFLKTVQDMMDEAGAEWDINQDARMVFLDDNYSEGRQAMQKKDYPGAVRLFRTLVRKYPDSLFGYKLLYRSLSLAGEYGEAEKVFTAFMSKTRKVLDRR